MKFVANIFCQLVLVLVLQWETIVMGAVRVNKTVKFWVVKTKTMTFKDAEEILMKKFSVELQLREIIP